MGPPRTESSDGDKKKCQWKAAEQYVSLVGTPAGNSQNLQATLHSSGLYVASNKIR